MYIGMIKAYNKRMKDTRAINSIALGNRIKAFRLNRGYTQEQLGDMVDCAPSYISEMERGKSVPSLSMLISLCKALSVDPTGLLQDLLPESIVYDECIKFKMLFDSMTDEQFSLLSELLEFYKTN